MIYPGEQTIDFSYREIYWQGGLIGLQFGMGTLLYQSFEKERDEDGLADVRLDNIDG